MENESVSDSQPRTEINELGEFGLIAHLTSDISPQDPSVLKGIGDDAAVILQGEGQAMVVTTDLLVEGIHFDLLYTPLKHLGYKSVVVNLSDVCAMNAIPKQITLSIAISSRFSVEALEEFYAGVKHACEVYGVDLVGGDTTSSMKGFLISVTAIGYAKEKDIVYRHTANEGDLLCVTGDLGGAYLGLQILEREKEVYLEHPELQPDLENQQYIVGRQLKPEARKDVVEILKTLEVQPTAMIDISDGLSSDLLHICQQSNVGAKVYEEDTPISKEAYDMALKFKLNPISCALSGGEDYELLFTIRPEDQDKLEHHPDVSIIGEILDASEGVGLVSKAGKWHEITSLGWEAFRKDEA